jgi:hypothetical protein
MSQQIAEENEYQISIEVIFRLFISFLDQTLEPYF